MQLPVIGAKETGGGPEPPGFDEEIKRTVVLSRLQNLVAWGRKNSM